MDSEFIEVQNLAKEKVTRGNEAAEEMLAEDDNLPGSWRWLGLLAGGAPLDVGRNEAGQLVFFECLMG